MSPVIVIPAARVATPITQGPVFQAKSRNTPAPAAGDIVQIDAKLENNTQDLLAVLQNDKQALDESEKSMECVGCGTIVTFRKNRLHKLYRHMRGCQNSPDHTTQGGLGDFQVRIVFDDDWR